MPDLRIIFPDRVVLESRLEAAFKGGATDHMRKKFWPHLLKRVDHELDETGVITFLELAILDYGCIPLDWADHLMPSLIRALVTNDEQAAEVVALFERHVSNRANTEVLITATHEESGIPWQELERTLRRPRSRRW